MRRSVDKSLCICKTPSAISALRLYCASCVARVWLDATAKQLEVVPVGIMYLHGGQVKEVRLR